MKRTQLTTVQAALTLALILLVATFFVSNASAQQRMMTLQAPDGSATIAAPGGWQVVNGGEGAISITNGDAIISRACIAGFTVSPHPYMPQELVLPYGRIEQVGPAAFQRLAMVLSRTTGVRQTLDRVLATYKFPNSNSAMFVIEMTIGGKKKRGYATAIATPTGGPIWLFTYSVIVANTETMSNQTTELMKIAATHKINPQLLAVRAQNAADTMSETTQIIQDVIDNRNRVQDRALDNFTEYLRDEGFYRNVETNEVFHTYGANGMKVNLYDNDGNLAFVRVRRDGSAYQ